MTDVERNLLIFQRTYDGGLALKPADRTGRIVNKEGKIIKMIYGCMDKIINLSYVGGNK